MRHAAIQLVVGLVVLVLIGWGLGELWVSVGDSADLRAVKDLVGDATGVAKVVTWLGSSVVLIPLTALAGLLFWRAGRPRDAIAVALSLGGAIVLWHVVKALVDRARPPVEHLVSVSGTSFPSGHATQAAAFWIALALALHTWWAGVAAAAIVLVVGASRVVLGVHYPGDVVAGALLGGSWALFVRRTVAT